MTEHTYTIEKHVYNGWTAETVIPLYPVEGGERVLDISTLKRNSGEIITRAQVCILKHENGMTSRTFEVFGDFSRTMQKVAGRATEKSIKAAHEIALLLAEGVKIDAVTYYEQKEG